MTERSPFAAAWLAVRSIVWTIALPGMVAGYVPWRFFGVGQTQFHVDDPIRLAGLAGIGAGVSLLVWCIWEFAHTGRGTLSPADPPRELVVRGLYQYVRNPMYLAVTLIVLGEALWARSLPLLWYWMFFFAAANLFVIGYEEPNLRRRFGRSYDEYVLRIGRWIPRWR